MGPSFSYERPLSLAAAVAALARPGARPLAGGTDLITQAREGRRQVCHVVDVKALPELGRIAEEADGSVAIGAAVTCSAVARAAAGSLAAYPAVASAARLVGSVQIQNRATLGGNICNAAPSADVVPALIAHGAAARIAGPEGLRTVPLAELFVAPGRTTLGDGRLLVAVVLPPTPARAAAAYRRFTPRREMDIAVAGAASFIELDEGGRIICARIVLASVAPVPLVALRAAETLVGRSPSTGLFAAAGGVAANAASPISDTRGSAEYRRDLVAVLVQRTLADCARQLSIEVAP